DPGINVDHGEDDNHPQTHVMPGVDVLAVRPDRKHPAEQLELPAVVARALRIERKAGDDHEGNSQREHEEHRELRERIVPDIFLRLGLQEDVPADLVQHLHPEALAPERHVEDLLGVSIAHEGPVDAQEEADGQHITGGKMCKADVAEQEMVARFAWHGRNAAADEVAGQAEHQDRRRIDPVPQPHRRFIDIDDVAFDAAVAPCRVGGDGCGHDLRSFLQHGRLPIAPSPWPFPGRPVTSHGSSRQGTDRRNGWYAESPMASPDRPSACPSAKPRTPRYCPWDCAAIRSTSWAPRTGNCRSWCP